MLCVWLPCKTLDAEASSNTLGRRSTVAARPSRTLASGDQTRYCTGDDPLVALEIASPSALALSKSVTIGREVHLTLLASFAEGARPVASELSSPSSRYGVV